MIIYLIIKIIFFIFMDELMMGYSQRRIGPNILGWFGILSILINGLNLCITQFIIPKFQIHYWFLLFLLLFLISSFIIIIILFPNLLIDISNDIFIIILLGILSVFIINLCSFFSLCKFGILGSFRINSQYTSYNLIFDSLIVIMIFNWNDEFINIIIYLFNILIEIILFIWNFYVNYIFLLYFLISILAESNRVPFDLLEAESELVAGFLIEFSSIYFSLILLIEYGSIILWDFLLIILNSIIPWLLNWFIIIICLIRCTLNRLKFDELMTNAWINILVILLPLDLIRKKKIVLLLCWYFRDINI